MQGPFPKYNILNPTTSVSPMKHKLAKLAIATQNYSNYSNYSNLGVPLATVYNKETPNANIKKEN